MRGVSLYRVQNMADRKGHNWADPKDGLVQFLADVKQVHDIENVQSGMAPSVSSPERVIQAGTVDDFLDMLTN